MYLMPNDEDARHDLDCECDECYAARDEVRSKQEENATWVSGTCPACDRDLDPVETRSECECGFRPWPGVEEAFEDRLQAEEAKMRDRVDVPGVRGRNEYEVKLTVFMLIEAESDDEARSKAMSPFAHVDFEWATAVIEDVTYNDPDPVCVCGTHWSEHQLCGCGEWERVG